MKTIQFLLYKEFRQIFRNKALLPIIFALPVVQLIILAYAADFEVKKLKLFVVDHDRSQLSQRLNHHFEGSAYFMMEGYGFHALEADRAMDRGEADIILTIPKNWESQLMREQAAPLQLVANAIDGTKGVLGTAYAGNVIRDFNARLIEDYGPHVQKVSAASPPQGQLGITYSFWFNPMMDYKTFMVPGILALLVTMVGAFLSSVNIVREKELGNIEQLNVTPIKKAHFIIGKLLPFWILAMFDFGLGLGVAKLLYQIPIEGNIGLLFGFAGLYLFVVLGLGLFISTVTETQQQAMFIAWFILVIFIFLSGLFTAIENMPVWAQQITYVNPVRYFIEVIRMIMLKGSGWSDIQTHVFIIGGYALAINSLAVWNYRKRI